MTFGLFDDIEHVNANDPVGVISSAGVAGIFEDELCRLFNWERADIVRVIFPLFYAGEIAGHLHGNRYLYYAPKHEGKVLQDIQRRLHGRRRQ